MTLYFFAIIYQGSFTSCEATQSLWAFGNPMIDTAKLQIVCRAIWAATACE